MSSYDQPTPKVKKAGAFDIRNFIGLLLGLYGVILLGAQFLDTEEQLAKADGLRVNLWTGLALVATAVVFGLWAYLRPLVVPAEGEDADAAGGDGQNP